MEWQEIIKDESSTSESKDSEVANLFLEFYSERLGFKAHDLNGKFNCSQCSTKFSSERSLEEHSQNVHGQILVSSQTYVCDICGTCLSAKSSPKQHLKIHLDKTFNCDICSANFKTERSLKEHKQRML